MISLFFIQKALLLIGLITPLGVLNEPYQFNASSGSVHFTVDSTWHQIHGTAKEFAGRIWLERSNDPSSARVEVKLPVQQFDTDSSRRDSRMREVMAAEKFPEVVVKSAEFGGGCKFAELSVGKSCDSTLAGELTIRGVTRPQTLHVHALGAPTGISFSGKTQLQWSDFGVEDPSIIVAKLDKTVEIEVTLNLPNTSQTETQTPSVTKE